MDCRLPITDCRLTRLGQARRPRRGFSFTEVLFAVMVMGIGFIMVAAMFPVTIRQQQSTQEETVSAAVARAALTFLQENDVIRQIANDPDQHRRKAWQDNHVLSVSEREPDGQFKHDDASVWDALAGNLILPENPRVAWVPLFRRADSQSGLAQVFIVVVQNRSRDQYQLQIPNPNPNAGPKQKALGSDVFRTALTGEDQYSSIEPKPVWVTTYPGLQVEGDADAPDRIKFENPDKRPYGNSDPIPDYAAWTWRNQEDVNGVHVEGAYVIIADPGDKSSERHMAGRIYQLGPRVDPTAAPDNGVFARDDIVYKLVPGNDMIVTDVPLKKDSSNKTGAKAYIIGRGLRDPTLPWDITNNPFVGPAQDVAIYMSYIKLQQP